MSGRKPAVPPTEVIEKVLQFQDRIVIIDENGEKKIVFGSNSVWKEISEQLDNRMSGKAIHTFVFEGRYSIKETLGIVSLSKSISQKNIPNQVPVYEENDISTSSDQSDMPTKKIVFTFSVDEWKQIQPQETKYKMFDKSRPKNHNRMYYALPKSNWTPILAEHFWEHTKLPCCLSFKRAKVTPNGVNYIVVVARCTICESHFRGTITERPSDNSRVLMDCVYTGNFNEEHKIMKKRRLIESTINKYTSSIFNEGISCETTREREAIRLMKIGDYEPAIIPSGNSLRALKSRKLETERRHQDTLTSLVFMQKEDNFANILHDIGCNPFFLHYHCSEQINIYRQYCKSVKYPKFIIDATGSIIKTFKKLNSEKTKTILLYEGLAYDDQKNCSFTVTNMISERHTSIEISNWLLKWLNCDVPLPKQTVCDQSLALLSAVVKCFTQYSSLQDYVRACASLLNGDIPVKSHWVPRCFVRIDVAHFIKNVSKWIPLKSVARRVREVILRAMGLLIKSQSLTEMRSILLSLFVVLTNETDGTDFNGEDTPCEKHKKNLISAISYGFIDFQTQFDELISMTESEDEASEIVAELYEYQNEGLDSFENPFQSWSNEIYNESKTLNKEGTGINPIYLPNLVPVLIKCTNLLPLWSGVMIPIFGYGEEVSSSAAIESSFKKLKTVTFNHIDLPTNVEIFLENHIASLKSSSILRSAKYHSSTEPLVLKKHNTINAEYPTQELIPILKKHNNNYTNHKTSTPFTAFDEINDNFNGDNTMQQTPMLSPDLEELSEKNMQLTPNPENTLLIPEIKCSLCSIGNKPKEGANKCFFCKKPIHNISSCSIHKPESSNERMCLVCSVLYSDDIRHENSAEEKWDRKNKKQRKNNSYLTPNPHLRYLSLNNSNKKKTLPILKNGSRFQELKGCKTNALPGKVIFNNTCAFDSLASLIMVSYCDGKKYSQLMDSSEKSDFINFIFDILKNGITSMSYSHRADLIINNLNVEQEKMDYDTTLINCDSTIGHVVSIMLEKYPSGKEISHCTVCQSIKERNLMHFTYQIDINSDISNLQEFLDGRLIKNVLPCKNCKSYGTFTTKFSNMHFFIEILLWEGENAISSDRSSEAAKIYETKLCEIPQFININSIIYELRGVLAFQRPKSSLRNSIGHYTAYTKRSTKNWKLFDDLKKTPIQTKDQTLVPVEFLFYSV